MKILIACEYSGIVRDAFIKKGHNAISCDILPSESDKGPHIRGDVRDCLSFEQWDMIIAHPPCTYLTNSGVRWLKTDPSRWEKLRKGCEFFSLFLDHPCPKICIENPVPHKYALDLLGGRSYTQTIQPYQFGHRETKRICLWLKGLPPLEGTENVHAEMLKLPKSQTHKVHYASPGADRAKIRSKFFTGVAQAMADQWG